MISTLRLAVVPSPASNDHEVRCLVDGDDIIHQLGGLGLDPDDFFSPSVAIAAGPGRDARIARCECGVVGCGDVFIQIAREGDCVVWNVDGREVRFDAGKYDAELARAACDFTWETPERTAARILRERLPNEALLARGLAFDWASGRLNPGRFTISLHPTKGAHRQILLELRWTDDVDDLVAAALDLLRRYDGSSVQRDNER